MTSRKFHREVEALCLLLVGAPLSHVRLAHGGVGGGGLDRLGGLAVLERLGHVEVLHRQHVLQRLHGGVQSLPHLEDQRTMLMMPVHTKTAGYAPLQLLLVGVYNAGQSMCPKPRK